MSVSFLYDAATGRGCLWCTTSACVFGPVFEGLVDARQLESFVEWMTASGIDPREDPEETVLTRFEQFNAERAVETRLAFCCEHCESVLGPHEVRSLPIGAVAGVVAYETPCPRCGRGDGDFIEIDVCAACGQLCEDRAAHVACAASAGSAPAVMRERKPPAASVRAAAARRLKEA